MATDIKVLSVQHGSFINEQTKQNQIWANADIILGPEKAEGRIGCKPVKLPIVDNFGNPSQIVAQSILDYLETQLDYPVVLSLNLGSKRKGTEIVQTITGLVLTPQQVKEKSIK